MWVSKIDADGQCEWLRSVADIHAVTGTGVGYLSDGSVAVSGYYEGDNADFGDTTLTAPYDNTNSFIAKYTSFGKFEFAAQFGGEAPIKITDLAIGEGDAIWVCGDFFSDTIRKDPTIGQFVLPTLAEGYDAFIVKFDKKGNALFALSMGGKGTDFATGIERGPGNKESEVAFADSLAYTCFDDAGPAINIAYSLLPDTLLFAEFPNLSCGGVSPQELIGDDLTYGDMGSIGLYPNPTSGMLNFQGLESFDGKVTERLIYDLYGRKISSHNLFDGEKRMDVGYLSPGIYYIKFLAGKDQLATLRFIKTSK